MWFIPRSGITVFTSIHRAAEHPSPLLACKRYVHGAETSNRGFGILEWTGKVVSQGTLVKGAVSPMPFQPPSSCFHRAGTPDRDLAHAGAKAGWNFAWQTMMQELAPQTKDGSYARPNYKFKGAIGSAEFPVWRMHAASRRNLSLHAG